MFPIRDKRGRVIAFGGRVLGDGMPKYLNSPETEVFHKGRQLYGLYEAQQNHPTLQRLLVVEGYMDVVALAQFGIDYAVASLGTSTTAEHIQLRFMFLPDGEDPDTLVRKEGKEAFEQRMEQAQPLSTFLFESLLPQVDLSSPDGRAKLSTLALPLITQVPGETLRLYLRQELGNKLGLLDDSQLDKLMPKQAENANPYQAPQLKRTTMRILIGLLVQNPQLATLIPSLEGLEQTKQAGLPLFVELVQTCLAQPGLTTGQLLELYRDNKFSQQLETLATWNHMIVEDMVEQTFLDTLASLYDSVLEQRLETLIAQARTRGLSPEEREEVRSLNQVLAKKN